MSWDLHFSSRPADSCVTLLFVLRLVLVLSRLPLRLGSPPSRSSGFGAWMLGCALADEAAACWLAGSRHTQ